MWAYNKSNAGYFLGIFLRPPDYLPFYSGIPDVPGGLCLKAQHVQPVFDPGTLFKAPFQESRPGRVVDKVVE